jgi:hypothetical protein
MTVSALAAPTIPTKTAKASANRVSTQRPASPRSSLRKWRVVAGGVFIAAVFSSPGVADPPDISAQRLLTSWKEGDPGMKMLAEVIASAFASGFSWGGDASGRRTYCAPPDLKGAEIMAAFEGFLTNHLQMAGSPYGEAMAATLNRAFPCAR